MTILETMPLDNAELGQDLAPLESRRNSDAELTAAFAPIVDDFADGLPVHPDMFDVLHKTLGQRYAGIFERLPQDSRYRKFGEVIQRDIIELLRRIGKDADEVLTSKSPHDFSRGAEQCALEQDTNDIFDGAALFVGSFVRQHVEVLSVPTTEQ